jgi:undecaprenyl diphosphate synthase
VAFDYGSRTEIAHAARRVVGNHQIPTVASMTQAMYIPDMPHVDVLVRTSGETRISNFLLWQAAGSPSYFTDNTWPDFTKEDLDEAIALAHKFRSH